MDLGALAQSLGLPVALAIYFIIENRRLQKEHLEDVKTITQQAITAINKNTDSDKIVADQLVKNDTALDKSTAIINKVEGILSSRERQNGNRGA